MGKIPSLFKSDQEKKNGCSKKKKVEKQNRKP